CPSLEQPRRAWPLPPPGPPPAFVAKRTYSYSHQKQHAVQTTGDQRPSPFSGQHPSRADICIPDHSGK
ncbi:hypothetical protein A2U01_0097611, partial [Trifolium medium]|nr:hypothetical protein [Trifolium medium]